MANKSRWTVLVHSNRHGSIDLVLGVFTDHDRANQYADRIDRGLEGKPYHASVRLLRDRLSVKDILTDLGHSA